MPTRAHTLLRRALILIEHRFDQTAPVRELVAQIKEELEKEEGHDRTPLH